MKLVYNIFKDLIYFQINFYPFLVIDMIPLHNYFDILEILLIYNLTRYFSVLSIIELGQFILY